MSAAPPVAGAWKTTLPPRATVWFTGWAVKTGARIDSGGTVTWNTEGSERLPLESSAVTSRRTVPTANGVMVRVDPVRLVETMPEAWPPALALRSRKDRTAVGSPTAWG